VFRKLQQETRDTWIVMNSILTDSVEIVIRIQHRTGAGLYYDVLLIWNV